MHTAARRSLALGSLAAALTLSCAEQQSLAPKTLPAGASRTNNSGGAGNYFFNAWTSGGSAYSAYPIRTQNALRDGNEFRQYVAEGTDGFGLSSATLTWAAANPGHLYINGDEPDQSCITPYDYAGKYKAFVDSIRAHDATAKFSPAGFAEPNTVANCPNAPHSTTYAQQFSDAYVQRFGSTPPVQEWRFHDFGLDKIGDVSGWYTRVSSEAAWSVSHGANMVLGSWGFLDWNAANGWNQPLSVFLDDMKQAMALVLNDTRINQAVWWSYENTGYSHFLHNSDSSLTAEGQVYSNVIPADIASSVTASTVPGARARLQWTNTTADWGIEAEFWMAPAGSSTFSPTTPTEKVAPGGTATGYNGFPNGSQVKGRVRYYNRLGNGPWSPFSNVVTVHT